MVEQYTEGIFIQKWHEHFLKSRLNNDARIDLLRALYIRFAGVSAEAIVRCYLNKIGRTPAAVRKANHGLVPDMHVLFADNAKVFKEIFKNMTTPMVRQSLTAMGLL